MSHSSTSDAGTSNATSRSQNVSKGVRESGHRIISGLVAEFSVAELAGFVEALDMLWRFQQKREWSSYGHRALTHGELLWLLLVVADPRQLADVELMRAHDGPLVSFGEESWDWLLGF